MKNKNINLLGCSSYTFPMIADIIKETYGQTSFLLYPNMEKVDKPFMPIKAHDYKIEPFGSSPNTSDNVFLATATPKNKHKIFNYFNVNFAISKRQYCKVVHKSAQISNSTSIGNGVLIEANAVISAQSKIEFGVFIKRGSLIGHHNTIGAFTDINPGAVICGAVKIGQFCTIGSGAVIKNNITIGDNTIIGIGSVVTKDIPSNSIAYGNPCVVVKKNGIKI